MYMNLHMFVVKFRRAGVVWGLQEGLGRRKHVRIKEASIQGLGKRQDK